MLAFPPQVNHSQHIETPHQDKGVAGSNRAGHVTSNVTMSPLSHPRLKQVVETSVSTTARKFGEKTNHESCTV